MLELQVSGGNEVREFMKNLPSWMWKDVDNELQKICLEVRNEVILRMRNTTKDFSKPAQRSLKGSSHYPSKPGFPPAIDSGNLIRAITIESQPLFHEYTVGTVGADYSVILEEGTTKKNYPIRIRFKKVLSNGYQFFGKEVIHPGIEPRPVWGPVAEEVGATLLDRIKERILEHI